MATTFSKLLDWTTKLAGAKSAVGELHAADRDLKAAHDAAQAERVRLLTAAPPPAELAAAADAEIQKLGHAWAATHRADVRAGLSAGFVRGADDAVEGLRDPLGLSNFGAVTLSALCALAPALVRDGLGALLAGDGVAPGPPMRDRIALVGVVDARIAEIEKQHGALVTEARAVGIAVEEMPENRSRRLRAEQAAERERAAAQERERDSRRWRD